MSATQRTPGPEGPHGMSSSAVTPVPAPAMSKIDEAKATARHFSIVVGGPVYDFFLRIGLIRRGLPNVRPRILAFVALRKHQQGQPC